MSGLCGWFAAGGGQDPGRATLEAMAARLAISSAGTPDLRCNRAAGLAVGAPAGGRLHADGDRIWCAIEGDFNWAQPMLADIAAAHGHGQALAEAYRRDGADLLQHLDGGFALAILEPERGTGLLAVDRFGLRRLCYAQHDGRLAFATSIDALRAVPATAEAVSPQSIYQYLHLAVIPAPESAYQDVQKLLAGECLRFENGRVAVREYWRPAAAPRQTPRVDDLARDLVDQLQGAVERSLAGQEPAQVGAFLSGGLDSSTVLGMATRHLGAPVKSFTIGFDSQDFDERAYADIAARRYRAAHHTYNVSASDAAGMIDRVAEAYDEPFGNSSAVATYFCARMARDHGVTMVLAGDGGDELFAGNERYVQMAVFDLYSRVPAALRRLLGPALLGLPAGDRVPGLRKLRSYVRRAQVPMPDRMQTYNFLTAARLTEVLEPDFLRQVDPDGPMRSLRRAYARGGAESTLRRMMHFDMQITLADNDLRKVTAMCDLAGMEVRFPFLDRAVAEFAASVPDALLIRHLRLRDFYKRALRGFLPPEVIAKRKHGFGMPIRQWIATDTPVREAVAEALGALRRRGIVRAAFIDRLLDDRAGQIAGEYGQLAWYLAVLERWLAIHRPERIA